MVKNYIGRSKEVGIIMNDGSNAKSSTGQIVSFHPTSEYYYTKGLVAYQKQDFKKSVRYLERAMQMDPLDEMIACQLGIIYSELEDYVRSNDIFLLIVKDIDPSMVECYYFLANNFAYLGMFKEASKYAKLYLEKESNGEFAEDIMDLLDVLEFEKEIDLENPYEEEDLIIKNEQSRKYLECGEFAEAIDLLTDIIEQYPKYWSAYNNLALAYFYTGEMKKASETLDCITNENPGNLHALCNRLVFAFYQKDYKTTVELKLALKKINPMNFDHQFKLGATFALVGEYETSYYWLKRLLKNGFEGDGTFYYWFSYASYFTDHLEEAKTAWEKVIRMSPEKIGLEPWNDQKILTEGFENHSTAILKKLTDEYIEERLVALFLISQSQDKEQLLSIKEVKKNPLFTHLEREYVKFIKDKQSVDNGFIHFIHETAEILYQHHHPVGVYEISLFLMWFSSALAMENSQLKSLNQKAWAASIVYLWYKLRGETKTLKEISAIYEISPSTLSKYVKNLSEMLS